MKGAVDWDDPTNIAKLELLLRENKSGSQVADAFNLPSRSAAIGAVHRLKEAGKIKIGFRKRKAGENSPRAKTKGLKSKRVVRGKNNEPEVVTFYQLEVPSDLEKFNNSRVGVPLLDRKSNQCAWPVKDDPYLFCGGPVSDKRYCSTHAHWSRRRGT